MGFNFTFITCIQFKYDITNSLLENGDENGEHYVKLDVISKRDMKGTHIEADISAHNITKTKIIQNKDSRPILHRDIQTEKD